jgi:shikimate kinase
MNILIIGTVGSGKTSIGFTLATMLKMKVIELDTLVLKHTGYSRIEDVYKYRVSLWKECELEISKDVSLEDNTVFICGGGFVENELNFTYFREHSRRLFTIYIHSTPQTIANRLKKITNNKDVKIDDRIKKIYEKRDLLCRLHADFVVENEKKEIVDVAEEVWQLIKQDH